MVSLLAFSKEEVQVDKALCCLNKDFLNWLVKNASIDMVNKELRGILYDAAVKVPSPSVNG